MQGTLRAGPDRWRHPTALAALEAIGVSHPLRCLPGTTKGDWGDLCAEDAAANGLALEEGARIFSSYQVPAADGGSFKVWVITEADRSATTDALARGLLEMRPDRVSPELPTKMGAPESVLRGDLATEMTSATSARRIPHSRSF